MPLQQSNQTLISALARIGSDPTLQPVVRYLRDELDSLCNRWRQHDEVGNIERGQARAIGRILEDITEAQSLVRKASLSTPPGFGGGPLIP